MPIDLLPRPVLCALSAYVFFYAPGHALIGHDASALPVTFLRVLFSVIVSTLVGTALAAAEHFTLPALLGCNAAVSVLAALARRAFAAPPAAPPDRIVPDPPPRRDIAGGLVVAIALCFYWPGYPVFLGASDSTAYVATGISLAHHGSFSREDELGASLTPPFRELLFDSMSQVFGSTGPPYRRMPGAMLLQSLDDTRAWPAFFPVPSVWAGLFVLARAPGGEAPEQAAPGYAPVFGALALWAFWHVARAWLGSGAGLVAVALLGMSGPFYTAARMPLSEGIAAYLALAGLAVLQARATRPRRLDAVIAGAALGAAVFTRVEIALLLALAFAIAPSLEVPSALGGRSRWPAGFFLSFLVVASMTLVQATLLPGSYISPLGDHLRNAWINYVLHVGLPSPATVAGVTIAAAVFLGLCIRRFGLSATVRWGFVLAVLAGHAGASNWLAERTPMWLSFYFGWPGLVLAAVGAALAWGDRARLGAAPLVLALAAATSLILFYNPHVYPALPWGARRFVPLLLPLLTLLACYGAVRLAARSRLASVAAFGVLGFGVVLGGRPVWGQDFMRDGWEQLGQLASAIPEGSTILVDRQVGPMMVGPALWLIHDRDVLVVPPTDSNVSRVHLPGLVSHLASKGKPLYLVTRGIGTPMHTPKVAMTLSGRTVTSLRFVEQTYDRRPQKIERYVMPLAVYRVEISPDPRGTVVFPAAAATRQ